MLNKVQLIGHVGHDPEIRETPQGTKVADLRLATTRYWRDGEGNPVGAGCTRAADAADAATSGE